MAVVKKGEPRPINHQDGAKIKHIRDILELTQAEFADHLDISQAALSYLEKGETTMSFPVFKNLVNVHNVNPYYFLSEGTAEPVFMQTKKQGSTEKEMKNRLVKVQKSLDIIETESAKIKRML